MSVPTSTTQDAQNFWSMLSSDRDSAYPNREDVAYILEFDPLEFETCLNMPVKDLSEEFLLELKRLADLFDAEQDLRDSKYTSDELLAQASVELKKCLKNMVS